MKIFLASPHTILRFKNGVQILCEYILQGKMECMELSPNYTEGGGFNDSVFSRGSLWQSKTSMG